MVSDVGEEPMTRIEDEKPMVYANFAKDMKEHDSVTLFDQNDVNIFLQALRRHHKDGEVIVDEKSYTVVCTTPSE